LVTGQLTDVSTHGLPTRAFSQLANWTSHGLEARGVVKGTLPSAD